MKNKPTFYKQIHVSKCPLLQPFIINLVFSSMRLHGHVLPEDITAREEKEPHPCHIGANAISQARAEHGQMGLCSFFPSETTHPVTAGFPLTFPPARSCATQVTCHPASGAGESSAHQPKAKFRNRLFCSACPHTVRDEEKVMRPGLPALRNTCQSPSGMSKTCFFLDGFTNWWESNS